ncbi:TetR/AcrR family transcriptional regulator [Nocardia rhizosphaerihabitans]|uniref:HTH tetR-type domain-containing protein n=1 Tax=Nocardia rhizosphaerihabitans TaxID=1691570 RepID=A0ABQ2KCW1_9NOCA|nr:TetR/AcrR family transcriptional regulator [Nocardia rhizosphaerihabitans]GGN78647.1 hypothetical protein GCM10011610_26430 [Nocardia rhizosphaerihabitans]
MSRITVAQRRSDLVAAAVEVIAVHGVAGATTRRIVEQAGANIAMVHYCYDSKDDLFADVYKFALARFRTALTESDPHTDLKETARQLLRGVMKVYLESPSFTAATLELISWARRRQEGGVIAVYDKSLDTARALLREASWDRPVESATIDQIAFLISILADGVALHWLSYRDLSSAAEQMEIAVSTLDSWLEARLESAPADL